MSFAARAIPLYGADPYPNASVALDFVRGFYKAPGAAGGSLSSLPGWSFSRTGVEYAATSSGLLVPFASGVPAVTDLGLQVWEARTNLLVWSRDLTNAAWSKRGTATATASAIAAPDGTVAGTLLAGIGAAGTNDVFQLPAATMAVNARYEPSFWINKVSSTGTLLVQQAQNATLGSWSINLASVASGWQRITRSHAAVTITTEFTATAGGLVGWQFAASAGAPLSFYVDFTKAEAGTFSGPELPTTSASATRGAASASVGGLSVSGDFTLFAQGTVPTAPTGTFPRIASLGADASNRVELYLNGGASPAPAASVAVGGSTSFSTTPVSLTPGAVLKTAMARTGNVYTFYFNGQAAGTATVAGMPALTSLLVGVAFGSGSYFDSTIQREIIYPTGFSAAQLASLTT